MSNRPETGPMQFDDDWTGVFIRGDNAAGYAQALSRLLEGHTDPLMTVLPVQSLLGLLRGSDERAEMPSQKMKPFPECVKEEDAT